MLDNDIIESFRSRAEARGIGYQTAGSMPVPLCIDVRREMDYFKTIRTWIEQDAMRMEALAIARALDLPDWCLAAGFVRNLVWDRLHEFKSPTNLNDIDLIYFDSMKPHEAIDRELENRLQTTSKLPWSVKNQARMHKRNSDNPYSSTEDAMSYWVEAETAVGATLSAGGEIEILAPLGIDLLFQYTITPNIKRVKPTQFAQRIKEKRWLEIWPKLEVNYA